MGRWEAYRKVGGLDLVPDVERVTAAVNSNGTPRGVVGSDEVGAEMAQPALLV